jgi:hypothetical protein
MRVLNSIMGVEVKLRQNKVTVMECGAARPLVVEVEPLTIQPVIKQSDIADQVKHLQSQDSQPRQPAKTSFI